MGTGGQDATRLPTRRPGARLWTGWVLRRPVGDDNLGRLAVVACGLTLYMYLPELWGDPPAERAVFVFGTLVVVGTGGTRNPFPYIRDASRFRRSMLEKLQD